MLNSDTPIISIAKAAAAFDNFLFLDARSYREYEVSHLRNATHTDPKNFSLQMIATVPNNQPIIVYCSIGKRSDTVTQFLIQAGYTNVLNLYGGIFEWVNMGLPVYDCNEQATTEVHAYNILWGRWLKKGLKVYK